MLDVSSPIGNHLSSLALSEKIQHTFNLHPGDILKAAKEQAALEGRDVASLLNEVQNSVLQHLLPECLSRLHGLTMGMRHRIGRRVRHTERTEAIIEYFNLDAEKLAEELIEKAQIEKFNPAKAALYLQAEARKVFIWAFEECYRILIKQRERRTA